MFVIDTWLIKDSDGYFWCRSVPCEAQPSAWEEDLCAIKDCCLSQEEDQDPALINRLALKRLRFLSLPRVSQSEVILDLMRSNRNKKSNKKQLETALIAQFPFCHHCARRVYGLSEYRWNVYNNVSLRTPNARRLYRSDIDTQKDGPKTLFFSKFLDNLMVLMSFHQTLTQLELTCLQEKICFVKEKPL